MIMTETFIIALDSILLPLQLICQDNSSKSYPWIDLPIGFSLLTNVKYYSNSEDSKIDEIIDPYLADKRMCLELPLRTYSRFIDHGYVPETNERMHARSVEETQHCFSKRSCQYGALISTLRFDSEQLF